MNLKPNFFDIREKEDLPRISYDQDDARKIISMRLTSLLPTSNRPIVFICIGTDRSTGDSLGPLIGSRMLELGISHFHVYGTLDEPIHAVNLVEKIKLVQESYRNPFIIGIDACLGRLKSVGVITIDEGPVKPGAGVNKELMPIGDIHITGIVNVSGFMEFFVLQNTRLSLVMKMANTIADGIVDSERLIVRRQEIVKYSAQHSQYKAP
ncbi:spore protease YyaC [Cytobacillus sp. S13-E01]|uniref:spore protease YyaC n=1 Tax=Cytobacillus sp. S13-E01 TaxID=3031326 RepID=UPI0023D7CF23|nr:spore protease YyaC [Cytobacillus sp. S13-E01]MDF0728497.1 spore protease YyaC [Cytobacillus sp. S13-E01]